MKTNVFVATIVFCVGAVHAVAIPSTSDTNADCTEVSNVVLSKVTSVSIPQFQHAMGNLSTMFGWQLAGAALTDDILDVTCANIANTGHGKWAVEGLVAADIREPICNASHAAPNATTAVPWALLSASELFITQILNAFNPSNTTTFSYLCTNLRFLQLDGFYLNDARVINATCDLAGTKLPPRPEGPVTGAAINRNATIAYANTASILYGLMFASSAISDTQLDILCAHAPDYVSNLNALMLNGTLVESTICGVTEPISVEGMASAIRTLTSRMFITVIENISSVDGWLAWLCSNVDVDQLETVGLDGLDVQGQICADANGLPL